jgi:hypothetical protein
MYIVKFLQYFTYLDSVLHIEESEFKGLTLWLLASRCLLLAEARLQ